MKIQITDHYSPDGKTVSYYWHVWAGPDGIDDVKGSAPTLAAALQQAGAQARRLEHSWGSMIQEETINEGN